MHYHDDFLTIGPSDTSVCLQNLQVVQGVYQHLGVPLAKEKVEGPSMSLRHRENGGPSPWWQITAYSLPGGELVRQKETQKRQILSLVGLLQHAVKSGKTWPHLVARMYKAAAKLKKLHHVTRLTKGFKSDLQWWHYFATNWNGVSFIDKAHARDQLHCIQTDASSHWGCGACLDSLWSQHAWSPEWLGISIMAKS